VTGTTAFDIVFVLLGAAAVVCARASAVAAVRWQRRFGRVNRIMPSLVVWLCRLGGSALAVHGLYSMTRGWH
jgi:hypothetical protein